MMTQTNFWKTHTYLVSGQDMDVFQKSVYVKIRGRRTRTAVLERRRSRMEDFLQVRWPEFFKADGEISKRRTETDQVRPVNPGHHSEFVEYFYKLSLLFGCVFQKSENFTGV